jgi:hypothetical protein
MFYHSFPRPKRGQNSIQKGLAILDSFLKNGILLVPETIHYRREKNEQNTPVEYNITQSRFCLTEIDISELKVHEKYFGKFHLEFSSEDAYALGTMPVFYLPRTESGVSEWSLKKLAAGYLYRLHDLQTICRDIQTLAEMLKGEDDQDTITINRRNRAKGETQIYNVKAKELRDVLDMLTLNLIPSRSKNEDEKYRSDIGARVETLLGALQGISSLFYPTDKDYRGEHEDLYYFRQREWRITAGISIDGKRLDQELNIEEKKLLMKIDPDFFGGKITDADSNKEIDRLEKCFYMPAVICETKQKQDRKTEEKSTEFKPIRDFIERIIMPKASLEEARKIAKKNDFNPDRIVDFETAMELAALELKHESAKIWAKGRE